MDCAAGADGCRRHWGTGFHFVPADDLEVAAGCHWHPWVVPVAVASHFLPVGLGGQVEGADFRWHPWEDLAAFARPAFAMAGCCLSGVLRSYRYLWQRMPGLRLAS